jgi:hypothetical protein
VKSGRTHGLVTWLGGRACVSRYTLRVWDGGVVMVPWVMGTPPKKSTKSAHTSRVSLRDVAWEGRIPAPRPGLTPTHTHTPAATAAALALCSVLSYTLISPTLTPDLPAYT